METVCPDVFRSYRASSGTRSAGSTDDADGVEYRPSGTYTVSFDRCREDLEGVCGSSCLSQSTRRREGPRSGSHILARALSRKRAEGVVCRHLAPGPLPLRRWREYVACL